MLDRLAGSGAAVDEDRRRRVIWRCAEVGAGHVEDASRNHVVNSESSVTRLVTSSVHASGTDGSGRTGLFDENSSTKSTVATTDTCGFVSGGDGT